jgi:BirA family biotin operon repressor/biotin-[acetyl-CoA-carboxylase] ligase
VKTMPLDWKRIDAAIIGGCLVNAETASTNDDARVLAMSGAGHGVMVLAEAQTAGRGRRGAMWMSPPRRNLLCSVVLRPALPVEKWSRLTHACALAVCEAMEELPGLPAPQIKWPNDVFLSGRKVCGILVESTVDVCGGFAIAGVGVNLNLTAGDLPEELRNIATSVWLERGGVEVSREEFAISFHRRLMVQCGRAANDFPALLAGCESRSFLTGKRVRLLSGGCELDGVADGVGPEGELRLIMDDGRVELVNSADFVRPIAQ